MVAIYVRWINAGKMVLSDVPEKWREEVQANVDALKAADEEAAQNISGDELLSMIEGVL